MPRASAAASRANRKPNPACRPPGPPPWGPAGLAWPRALTTASAWACVIVPLATSGARASLIHSVRSTGAAVPDDELGGVVVGAGSVAASSVVRSAPATPGTPRATPARAPPVRPATRPTAARRCFNGSSVLGQRADDDPARRRDTGLAQSRARLEFAQNELNGAEAGPHAGRA